MSEGNKSEKSYGYEESMDSDEKNYFYKQINSVSEGDLLVEKSPQSNSEAFENERNNIQNLKVMISKTRQNKKPTIKEKIESTTKYTATKDKKTNNTKMKDTTTISECKTESDERRDNLIDKCWRAFFEIIINLCNIFCKKENLILKKTNFKQIFGSSIEQNKAFLNLKVYKYFCYNTVHKDNNQNHKQTGSYNKEIIEKMIEKDNTSFIAIMKCHIKYLFEQYIGNKKVIKVGNIEYQLPDFNTIDDVMEEKRNNLQQKQKELNPEEINKELEKLDKFENQSKSLISHICVKGKSIQRKHIITNNIEFLTIDELEDK